MVLRQFDVAFEVVLRRIGLKLRGFDLPFEVAQNGGLLVLNGLSISDRFIETTTRPRTRIDNNGVPRISFGNHEEFLRISDRRIHRREFLRELLIRRRRIR